jgi:hypothetical protein
MLETLTDLPVRHGTLVISDLEHFSLEHCCLRNSLSVQRDLAAASELLSLLCHQHRLCCRWNMQSAMVGSNTTAVKHKPTESPS